MHCVCLVSKEVDGMGTSRTVVIDGCDLSTNRCWELNLGPLEEQPVLLTDEASLWP